MDKRKAFAQRMLNAAQQFRRELAAADDLNGVVDTDAIEVTADASGCQIVFFETAAGSKAKKAGQGSPDDPPADHG